MKNLKYSLLALASTAMLTACGTAVTHEMTVETDKVGAPVQPTMYGVFFEDINFAADGGIYADMVKNRSFEFPDHLAGWQMFGNVTVKNDGPFERNPHYVHFGYAGQRDKFTGIENEGFFGMGIKKDAKYNFSVWARGNAGIRVSFVDDDTMEESQILVEDTLNVSGNEWKKYELTLTSPVTMEDAHLRLTLIRKGDVDLEYVSLMPADNWNGLRADLVQALSDLKPGVFRFPGGCIVEGADLATRYQWKNSVGPVENRPLNENRWEYTFDYKLFPDYFTSYGLGFYEYFCLAEKIGAEPLPVISCGLACQFQNDPDDMSARVAVKDLGPYVQDALDLVEFANGGTDTKWGALRAQMGHPEPFNLKFLAVGNEQWGPLYPERLEVFIKALREKCPDIKIIGTSGPNSEGEDFEYLWPEMKRLNVDLVDEHFYRPEKWFLSQGNRYDSYDRQGPKVFAGEYACHGAGKKWNHFEASLLEAAFMTDLERNADIVHMATYAPLFAHVKGWQWRPDLIWYDNLRSVRSCSYYVQQMYSLNKGTNVLPLTMDGKAVAGNDGQDGLFASAVLDAAKNEWIVKIINTSDAPQGVAVTFAGAGALGEGEVTSLHSDDLDADNTLDEPEKIVPVTSKVKGSGNVLKATIPAKTFSVYKFPVNQ